MRRWRSAWRKGITVIAFIQAQAFRTPPPFADLDAVNRCQNIALIVPIGFAQREIQRVAVAINYYMTFDTFDFVLARVADLIVRPLFDFTTLAS
jgi:hypothetical protein